MTKENNPNDSFNQSPNTDSNFLKRLESNLKRLTTKWYVGNNFSNEAPLRASEQTLSSSEKQLGAVEKIGLIPRSIIRTINRFQQQLFPDAVEFFIQEFRVSRSQVLVSLQCLLTLIIIPLFINFAAKTFVLTPFIEYGWNTYKPDLFLNSYQQEQALMEMRNFEEVLYFDLLTQAKEAPETSNESPKGGVNSVKLNSLSAEGVLRGTSVLNNNNEAEQSGLLKTQRKELVTSVLQPESFDKSVMTQKKLMDLAEGANNQSIAALTNLFADLLTLASLIILFIRLKPQIIILKSFLIETFYSLNDTTKSFLLIFSTDLLVGFHSPRGWEIFLDFVLSRFGLPHDENIILLFVATFPVLLDSVIKYWIFRYLNKISPSTVATYHAMIE